MLEVHAIKGPTGRLLREMLSEKGLVGGRIRGIVNYGYGSDRTDIPVLNRAAGHLNKYQELVKLDQAGVATVPFSKNAADLEAPIFGRDLHHTRGNDIFAYRVRPLLRADRRADYYTEVVPKAKEFRVWVFRDKFLAAYEKVLQYPAKLGRRGRSKEVWNWANGYAYDFLAPEDVEPRLRRLGGQSVTALGLDFGAVDILKGQNGHYYVLECNTAPGVEGRRQGITSLVNCIERWAKNGFAERD